jgi:hypothetical protein
MSWRFLNRSAGSRLGSSDQHFLHFSPSGPKTERFREILIDQINGVSKRANNCGQSASVRP